MYMRTLFVFSLYTQIFIYIYINYKLSDLSHERNPAELNKNARFAFGLAGTSKSGMVKAITQEITCREDPLSKVAGGVGEMRALVGKASEALGGPGCEDPGRSGEPDEVYHQEWW